MSTPESVQTPAKFGFLYGKGSPHTARTLMLEDLRGLFAYCAPTGLSHEDFSKAILEDNCLAKRSGKTRSLTYQHLRELYALDPKVPLFRVLLYLWTREEEGHALLAALCAFPRDPLFRRSFEWITKVPIGEQVTREAIETELAAAFPDRFSPASLKSIAQNLNSSWTKTGHLRGKVRKFRQKASPTPASTAFALYLGYLTGLRGESLFHSPYCRVLDASPSELMDKADAASRRGWITMKRLGNIIEVSFPGLITSEERSLLNER